MFLETVVKEEVTDPEIDSGIDGRGNCAEPSKIAIRARWRTAHRCAAAILAVMGTAVLVGCQPGAPTMMSLDEARKVAAEFAGRSFTAPPKSIGSVLDDLKEKAQKSFNCSSYFIPNEAWIRKEMLAAGPPKPGPGGWNSARVADRAAKMEFLHGNFNRAAKYMRWALNAIDLAAWKMKGARLTRNAKLAYYLAEAGDLDAAEDAASEALQYEYGRRPEGWGKALVDYQSFYLNMAQGVLAQSQSDLKEAEGYFRRAMVLGNHNRYLSSADFGFAQLILARNLMYQGDLVQAEALARETLARASFPGSNYDQIPLVYLSEIIYEQGRYSDAEALTRASINHFRAKCIPDENVLLARLQVILGQSLVSQGHWQQAFAHYEAVRLAMENDPKSYDRLFSKDPYRAIALLKLGYIARAEKDLKRALDQTAERLGADHYNTAEIRGFLAMVEHAKGNPKGALGEFSSALKSLLSHTYEADADNVTFVARDNRLRLIAEDYISLLEEIRGSALESEAKIDAVTAAFRLAEAVRSKNVQRALSASAARARTTDRKLAQLVRQEQDTQKRITTIYGTLIKAISSQDGQLIGRLRERIARLKNVRTALVAEIGRQFPDYAALMSPAPPSVAEARASLRPDEALIATYAGAERTYVWAVPKAGPIRFAAVPLGRERIAVIVRDLRRALQPNATKLGDIPDFDVELAHRLFMAMLAPVAPGWEKAKSLLVIAHGPLGQIPFQLLVREPTGRMKDTAPLFSKYRQVAWLARSHAVTVLPSVGALATLRRLPPTSPNRRAFAGFGDPLFSKEQADAAAARRPSTETAAAAPDGVSVRGLTLSLRASPNLDGVSSADLANLPRLPDTADEIRSIALALSADLGRDVFIGKAATEGAVKRMTLSGYKVIAFATHGLVPGDLDGLTQPALALTSPDVAGGDDDGLLTMGEIMALELDADWVLLSACNTASGAGAGAEAVSGLGRAFFYAGTRALLVSNWPVETTSARALTTDLFRRQAADPKLVRAEALRRTMLGLIDGPGLTDDKGRTVFSYAHPIFWAPFSLVGDGGARSGRQLDDAGAQAAK